MEKEVNKLTSNLLLIFIAYVATIAFNLQLFNISKVGHMLYGITLLCLCGATFYCLYLLKKGDAKTCAKIATIIGPIMAGMSLVEGFTDLDLRFIQNIPFTGWIFLICGIIIYFKSVKIHNNKKFAITTIMVACLLLVASFTMPQILSKDNNLNTEGNNQKLPSNSNNNTENNNDNGYNGEKENLEKNHDYQIDKIQNVIVEVPKKNATDPEMHSVTVTKTEEIKIILANVTNLELVGNISNIGFVSNVTITVNYAVDSPIKIILLDNGNVAINFSVGTGETGYVEYKITNKNLSSELQNKYQ